MKVTMVEWFGGIKNLPSWWKKDTEADVSAEQLQELFDTGNNYMLAHSNLMGPILFVDDKRFGQR